MQLYRLAFRRASAGHIDYLRQIFSAQDGVMIFRAMPPFGLDYLRGFAAIGARDMLSSRHLISRPILPRLRRCFLARDEKRWLVSLSTRAA